MNRACRAAATAVLLLAASAVAQPPAPDPANLRGDSAQTGKRLDEARQKIEAGQAADAADALQRILDDAGDDLVLVSAKGKHYRSARWVAHALLARLPADTLKGYQDRVEEPARKLLDAARKTRDPAPLWQLLDRYFVSRPADEGSLLLGELLFERGEFRLAEQVWRRLLPDGGADVTYPNSKADPAAVRARLILAAIFQCDPERAKADLAAFTAKHPGAKGPLAGKDGPLADTLQATLDARPQVPAAANVGREWPTFGGGPDRSGRLGVRLPYSWPAGQPTWTRELFRGAGLKGIPGGPPQDLRPERLPDGPIPFRHRHGEAPFSPPARPPFGHPVIANGRVFVTDGSGFAAFDLVTGDSLNVPNKLGERIDPPAGQKRELIPPDPSPALTAVGDRVYVRAGPQFVRPPEAARIGAEAEKTAIVCLGPAATMDLKQLWRLPPPGDGPAATAWEGAPLVAGRRMWAAYAQFEGGRVVHGIACFDPADAATAPPSAWTVEVCEGPMPTGGDPRVRQELLTLAGRNVVFCSNAGAVVAVDAVTGKRAWGVRYPRSRKAESNRSPDPSPAVYAAGRVFVAPTDADRVYALDAETGRIDWESEPTEGAQILGVAAGRVIVSVTGPAGGLRGLNVATGSHREGGWARHGGPGGPTSYGRGLVTDDLILWPTRGGLFFVRPEDGELRGPPLARSPGPFFGHVAFADGVLVVVTPTQVWGYLTEAKRFGPAPGLVGRDPVRAKFEDLCNLAELALADRDEAKARELLLAATKAEFPGAFRAWAAARLLLLAPKVDDEAMLPADLRVALAPELRDEWVFPPDGAPATLETLILRHTGREPRPDVHSGPSSPALEADRKPEAAPGLSPEAAVARTLQLPPGTAPLRWLPGMETPPGRLFLTTAEELVAVSLDTGAKTRHAAADAFTHAAEIAEGFVAAGRFAVAVFAAGRAPEWVFRVPVTDPLPQKPGEVVVRSGAAPARPELSAFRLTGSWLVARLGERHLIAIDLKSRRVAWVLGADGRLGFRPFGLPGATRFGPEFFASGNLVVAQLSDGRRWFIRAGTGRVLDVPGFDFPTARVWWGVPPTEVEPNRLAVSDGPGLVRTLNLATGRVKWSRREDGEASLAGDPPQVRAWGAHILIAVRRNHGVDLDRLDMADGWSVWKEGPAFLDADRIDLRHADADAERVYVPTGKALVAVALKDGKTAWEAELPDTHGAGGWVVRAGRKCVIAYPESAIPREPVADVLGRVWRSFRGDPRAARLPGLGLGLYDAWVTRSVPVLLFDPETGKQLNRLDVPAAGPAVTAWFERDLAVVATGDRVVWLR